MATVDMELALVRRFYSVCQRFDSRPAIARRNTLPTLIRFLNNTEREVRKVALESLLLLAEHPENVDTLASNAALEDGLSRLTQETQYDDPELHALTCRVAELLMVAPSAAFDEALSQPIPGDDGDAGPETKEGRPYWATGVRDDRGIIAQSTSADGRQCAEGQSRVDDDDGGGGNVMAGFAYTTPARGTDRSPVQGNERHVSQSALGSSFADTPYMLTVDVPAVNARSDSAPLEQALQGTPGVISYTIFSSAHQVRVLMSTRGDNALQQALAKAGYASLVVGAERMTVASEHFSTPMRGNARSYFDKSSARPSYLQKARSFASSMYNAVVVYGGAENNTLAARVERQREVEQGQRSATAERLARAFAQWW